ncbi:MAG: hypothetical protein AAF125_05335, partial [Chloroflexota bacterium]
LQLPLPEQAPLIWTLLKENLRELNEHAADVAEVRASGNYFESSLNPRRRLGEIALSGDNLFYLLFMGGHINPSRGTLLMLFLNAIPRNIDATDMLKLAPASDDAGERYPFQLAEDDTVDDSTVRDLKAFLHAMYLAWLLDVDLLIDA